MGLIHVAGPGRVEHPLDQPRRVVLVPRVGLEHRAVRLVRSKLRLLQVVSRGGAVAIASVDAWREVPQRPKRPTCS